MKIMQVRLTLIEFGVIREKHGEKLRNAELISYAENTEPSSL